MAMILSHVIELNIKCDTYISGMERNYFQNMYAWLFFLNMDAMFYLILVICQVDQLLKSNIFQLDRIYSMT